MAEALEVEEGAACYAEEVAEWGSVRAGAEEAKAAKGGRRKMLLERFRGLNQSKLIRKCKRTCRRSGRSKAQIVANFAVVTVVVMVIVAVIVTDVVGGSGKHLDENSSCGDVTMTDADEDCF